MWEYLDYITTDRTVAFVYIVLIIAGALIVSYSRAINNPATNFFMVTAAAAVVYMYYNSTREAYSLWRTARDDFRDHVGQKAPQRPTEMVIDNVYKLHKSPKTFKYIYKHDDVLAVIHSLRFLKRYDEAAFERIIIFVEAFFKEYDRMLVKRGRYPCETHFSVLGDMRTELLNEIARAHYNVPERFKAQIDAALKTMQAITYKVIKVMSAKCNKWAARPAFSHKPPFAQDPRKESHELF